MPWKKDKAAGGTGVTLDDFIPDTLHAIVSGIDKAKTAVGESQAFRIAPAIKLVGEGSSVHDADVRVYLDDGTSVKGHLVRFDVAVHAAKGKKGGGGVEVGFAGLGIAGKGELSAEEGRKSRIRFDIPLILAMPPDQVRERELQRLERNRQARENLSRER